MKNAAFLLLSLVVIFPYPIYGQTLNYTLSQDSMVNVHASNKRVYNTVRTAGRPKIDGILDDLCWEQDAVWAGGFVQQAPRQAAAPSQQTEIKLLYDDDNLYIAIRCHDNSPEGIRAMLGRRDDWTVGDITGVALDTYHDKQTAFEFNVTAAGQKIDLQHLGAFMWDTNWNAVWDGKAHVSDSLWTVEMRVPFSQLRFSDEPEQAWGMHVWRYISRLGEEDQWKLIPIDAPAMVYIFGELRGIRDIPKKHHFEMMPYAGLQYISQNKGDKLLNFGLDGKAALSSNFTLDYTVFPDFGQVEADPSVLNLAAYEVFFQERRPFFLEGHAILEYAMGSDILFYSRRIGHAPSLLPALTPTQTVTSPSTTDIISALKVTGKSKKGFSLGIINGMTQREYAEVEDAGSRSRYAAEPFSNYFIARAKQDLNKGNTTIGGMFTSVLRKLDAAQFKESLPSEAYTGGFDILHNWKNRKYFVDAKSFFSSISGSSQAITNLQQSPVHLFQRTDAAHLSVDEAATQLSGWGGELSGGKQSGKFRVTGNLSWRSEGLDLNDIGYLREADIITQGLALKYLVNEPKGILRSYQFTLEQRHDWNFGGENTLDLLENTGELRFNNLWALSATLAHAFNKLDTRQLRGGPALRIDPHSLAGIMLSTDATKVLSGGVGLEKLWYDNGIGGATSYQVNFLLNLSRRFTITSNTYYQVQTDNNQFVPASSLNIAGKLERKTLYTTLRAEYFVTPELSLQYYGSPYASVGKFSKIYKVSDPHAKEPAKRYSELVYQNSNQDHQYYRENDPAQTVWEIDHPDFSFQEFRSNFVLRWEYKPGSTFFFVWSHNRSNYDPQFTPSVLESFGDIGDAAGNNALTVKCSYWFSL
ncbi:MAG: carbohydrate binding family 9 domain-containing protein [Lewinellaceae bacterium]|nr:carbohydrate binding family 9 domain-containing protein [Lewinellaceae bacterium]